MKFSEDQLTEIEKYASIFMPPSDIATLMGVKPDAFRSILRMPDHPAANAYRLGKAKSKAALRANEMRLARIGSPLGLESTSRALSDMELDE